MLCTVNHQIPVASEIRGLKRRTYYATSLNNHNYYIYSKYYLYPQIYVAFNPQQRSFFLPQAKTISESHISNQNEANK